MATPRYLFYAICFCAVGFLLDACKDTEDEIFLLPTKICVKTSHHGQPIPNAVVYVKYNTNVFPGYDQPASFYDATFYTDAQAYGCLTGVPIGKHWLVAFGYDSLHYPHHVFGSLPVELTLEGKITIDTTLYVSE
jgi:hypothetical protein